MIDRVSVAALRRLSGNRSGDAAAYGRQGNDRPLSCGNAVLILPSMVHRVRAPHGQAQSTWTACHVFPPSIDVDTVNAVTVWARTPRACLTVKVPSGRFRLYSI